jgi:hypothetical protein
MRSPCWRTAAIGGAAAVAGEGGGDGVRRRSNVLPRGQRLNVRSVEVVVAPTGRSSSARLKRQKTVIIMHRFLDNR